MSDLNKVMLIGRLKAAPVMDSSGAVLLQVVTSHGDGEQVHLVVARGALGAKCQEHLKAGRLVYAEGALVGSQVHATDVHFLGKQRTAG